MPWEAQQEDKKASQPDPFSLRLLPFLMKFEIGVEMPELGTTAANATTFQSCSKCLLTFPSQQLIKMVDKYYCSNCRNSLGLASQVNVARLLPSHVHHLLGSELQHYLKKSTGQAALTSQAHRGTGATLTSHQHPHSSSSSSSNNKSLTKVYQKLEPEPLSRKEEALVPEWMKRARSRVLKRYPNDFFSIVIEEGEPKIKCYDCVKMYASGPNQTLKNFEIHMSNRAHRNAVRKRVSAFRRSLLEEQEKQAALSLAPPDASESS